MTMMVNAMVKNGVPRGQILKLQKPYRVASQMKALDEHFPDQ
jgi:IS5 family transposase